MSRMSFRNTHLNLLYVAAADGQCGRLFTLFSYSNCEVLTTLTPDSGRILSKLHAVQPKGKISFCTGIRVAHVCNLCVYGSAKIQK